MHKQDCIALKSKGNRSEPKPSRELMKETITADLGYYC